MAKDKANSIAIPIDSYVLAKLKGDPVEITIKLTLQAVGYGGELRVRAHLSRPRVKRLKGGAASAASDAG
jgi:hypothetical protein